MLSSATATRHVPRRSRRQPSAKGIGWGSVTTAIGGGSPMGYFLVDQKISENSLTAASRSDAA
jgi:hypothetical protein